MKTFQESLPMMLYRVLGQVLPHFRSIFSQFGLAEQQGRVLCVLWEGHGIPLLALSEQTLIPAPSLVGVVDRLQRADLVCGQRCRDERRLVRIVFTPKARALEAQVTPRVDAAYEALEGLLSANEWNQLRDFLSKIIAHSHALDAHTQAPKRMEQLHEC